MYVVLAVHLDFITCIKGSGILILQQVKFYSRHRLLISYRKKTEEEEEEEEEIIIYIINGPFSVGPMHYQGFVYYTMSYAIQILGITYILYFGINESHCRRACHDHIHVVPYDHRKQYTHW